MPLFRALAKNMAASYFGKKASYGFVMEVTLLYVFILCPNAGQILVANIQSTLINSCSRLTGARELRKLQCKLSVLNFHQLSF
jgi:hypothetical protein